MTDVANLQVSDTLAVYIPPLTVFRHVGRHRAARSVPHLLALAINVRFAVGTGPPGGQLRSDQICGVGAGLCAGGTGQRQEGVLVIFVRWSAFVCCLCTPFNRGTRNVHYTTGPT